MNQFFSGLRKGQKKYTEAVAALINSILLTLVYIIGVGLISIFAKIFGKNFLDTKIDKNKQTYWKELNLTKKPMEDYYRQF